MTTLAFYAVLAELHWLIEFNSGRLLVALAVLFLAAAAGVCLFDMHPSDTMKNLIARYNALSPVAKTAIKYGAVLLAGLILGLIL